MTSQICHLFEFDLKDPNNSVYMNESCNSLRPSKDDPAKAKAQ